MFKVSLLALSGLVMGVISCSENRPRVEVDILFTDSIGSDNPDSSDYLFGRIIDLKTDAQNNLYILDGVSYSVKKFDSLLTIQKIFSLGRGRGPGEFIRPNQIAVDSIGRVFVSDLMLRKLVLFDTSGLVLKTIDLKMMPAQIVPDKDSRFIFVVGYLMSYKGPLVHRYNLVSGLLDTAFCDRYPEASLVARTGNSDRLILASDGSLFLSQHYPYSIIHIGPDRTIKKVFSRSVDYFEPPRATTQNIVESISGNKGLVLLNDSVLVNVIFGAKAGFYFDFFDLEGRHLATVKTSSEGIARVRYIAADRRGNIYLDSEATYPIVQRYSVNFKPL